MPQVGLFDRITLCCFGLRKAVLGANGDVGKQRVRAEPLIARKAGERIHRRFIFCFKRLSFGWYSYHLFSLRSYSVDRKQASAADPGFTNAMNSSSSAVISYQPAG